MIIDQMEDNESENFYVSWSDLVTLLLVFFVYLYSISEIDITRFLEARESLNSITEIHTDMDKLELIKLEREKLKEIMNSIRQFIEKEELENVVNVEYVDDKLEINLGNQLLFELGEAALRWKAQQILDKISVMFNESNSKIVVEGHTDDIPIHTEHFPSNWELSSARASSVVRYLASKGVDEGRFLVLGYNKYVPVAPNDSEENRSKNRRVKITLKPDMEKILAQKLALAETGESDATH